MTRIETTAVVGEDGTMAVQLPDIISPGEDGIATALDRISISRPDLAAFCRRWRIRRLSLFGSILRDDFRDTSDVDVLVSLRDDAALSLWDWSELRDELRTLLNRDVDLVEESGLRNPFRRHEIMRTRQVIYADSAN